MRLTSFTDSIVYVSIGRITSCESTHSGNIKLQLICDYLYGLCPISVIGNLLALLTVLAKLTILVALAKSAQVIHYRV